MENLVSILNGIIWSNALIVLCLGTGLYFSVRTRFLQVRHFKEMFRLLFDGKSTDSGVSSFQALSMSLAGRVGTGNIAGVATAIAFGGPGAMFWMWLVAFLGASTAFIEATLAQIYKEKHLGQLRGGPAFYIERGLGVKWFGVLFAVVSVISAGVLLPGVQANSVADGIKNAFNLDTWITGTGVVLIFAAIVFGGVKRIAKFTEYVVPFMAIGYIVIALLIIIVDIKHLPDVILLVFKSAFNMEAGFGAVFGLAVQWGVKRGIYSNEAGQGTAPHIAAAANVSHPVKQGLVQSFSVYIDTLLVCSATGFMLLMTGKYNVYNPAFGTDEASEFLYTGAQNIAVGPGFTQSAMDTIFPGFGSYFVAIALFFFAFTTILAYYYIAETNISYLTRKFESPVFNYILKIIMMLVIMYGSVNQAKLAWEIGDIGVGLMAWFNIIAILLLQKPALAALKDYEKQKKQGKDPLFNPEDIGVTNAHIWNTIDKNKEF
ncbi:MAG TPA: alanine/glycine:cation symporter family protein [Flavobacterium sp.]|uniref:alanine/glycine:cation symporter family protein n=1 Tax=Flavobacterium sp. TaxID=239 RepID=UPI001B64462B|nr:alanine/glycine:cation symporter family protein [Flavobacterium sp.]MBP7317803.1 alanine:cation symporter family protein [Flavobacterium sp.]MBP7397907.1 alanine:cation symporter family protein [Flavobacterium sp.]HRL70926.1 alanine/glycine:cation symporter family protein [Flavobacterium sp.]HRM45641.1 alanine/glycine:cation symporter family protein [Flavobacterium sp.]